MRVWRLRGAVVFGELMVKGRSGIGGEKRMMRKRDDVILAVGGRWRGGWGKRRILIVIEDMMEMKVFWGYQLKHCSIAYDLDISMQI